jgi:hypothetical protein
LYQVFDEYKKNLKNKKYNIKNALIKLEIKQLIKLEKNNGNDFCWICKKSFRDN